jgi:hypothetical protein
MEKVTSRDGTAIAFDRLGEGPPVILVCGAMCDRALMRPTAEELAKRFTAQDGEDLDNASGSSSSTILTATVGPCSKYLPVTSSVAAATMLRR